MIPEAAVEAAVRSLVQSLRGDGMGYVSAEYVTDMVIDVREFDMHAAARGALEAAAPHMLAGVTALADAWEARGEHDMEVSKAIKDEYIASEILGHGAQMVENARHIRNALGTAK